MNPIIQSAAPQISGVLNINKPAGMTSFEVVRQIRQHVQIKRMGHCGTLDPMATGVLVLVFGPATVFSNALMEGEKVYLAEMTLGIQTDTADMTGKMIARDETLPQISGQTLHSIFQKFIGDIVQVPPLYSAVKRNGMKLYQYARAGLAVTPPPRIVTIKSIDLLSIELPKITFRVVCMKGTYIRTLAEDIARELKCHAALSALVRERVGRFSLENSLDFFETMKLDRANLLAQAESVG